MRFMIGVWLLFVAGLVGTGAYMAWHAFVVLPGAYDRLRAHGVSTNGLVERCSADSVASRGYNVHLGRRCHIVYTYDGVRHDHAYPNTFQIGSGRVRLLVDPEHPETAFTVSDVNHNRGADWDTQGWIAVGLIAAGALLFFGARALQ